MKEFLELNNIPNARASKITVPGCAVLEGGAFRGMYTCGVLDALMENDINLQTVVGVSAGALNGLNYITGQIGRSARINLEFRHDSRYIGVKAVRSSRSVVGFDFLFGELNKYDPFDEDDFFASPKRYIAQATSCETGQPRYFEKGICEDIFQGVRASASMQILSKMVEVEGEKCLDGGCSKRIPLDFALSENFEKIVVVRTRDKEYRKEEKKSSLQAKYYRKFPEYSEALLNSNFEYNDECDECDKLEAEGRIFQIVPSKPIAIGRLEKNLEKLYEVYTLGYNDAMERLDDLKKYLEI